MGNKHSIEPVQWPRMKLHVEDSWIVMIGRRPHVLSMHDTILFLKSKLAWLCTKSTASKRTNHRGNQTKYRFQYPGYLYAESKPKPSRAKLNQMQSAQYMQPRIVPSSSLQVASQPLRRRATALSIHHTSFPSLMICPIVLPTPAFSYCAPPNAALNARYHVLLAPPSNHSGLNPSCAKNA